ncbi:MAG: aminofutalosine synthase MqnE [Thermodesulfovibrionales bacterium]|nr:aminofutalosine synthase MqnE [Thermodesulfovibrionales bacterium]
MIPSCNRIKNKVLSEKRLTKKEALALFESDDIFTLGKLASYVAKKKNGNKAYFIRNIHVNPTNICVNRCKFCAFSRSKGEAGAYEMTIDEIAKSLQPSALSPRRVASGDSPQPFSEVHIVGGLHPDWPFEYYLEMISRIKKSFPKICIKAFTATEIDYFSRISGKSVEDTLIELKKHGLDTMPGGGAEIFDTGVRNQICPEKLSGEGWINVMEAAHRAGIKTNATMLYGHVENYEQRVDHLIRLRELQDKTKGFQAFIPLAYHPKNTEIGGTYSSGIDDLKTIAVSRLVLDNFAHIKAYWIMLGEKLSQVALLFGADDIDGTIIDEKVTHSAGALSSKGLTAGELINMIKKAGKVPIERDSFYRAVK